MTRTRIIALIAGAITTSAVFITAMWLLVFGEYFPERDRLVMVSIAVGPVAVVSVMTGFAVWWAAMFALTLFCSSDHRLEDFGDGTNNRRH